MVMVVTRAVVVMVVVDVSLTTSSYLVMTTINDIKSIKTPIILTPFIPSTRSNSTRGSLG